MSRMHLTMWCVHAVSTCAFLLSLTPFAEGKAGSGDALGTGKLREIDGKRLVHVSAERRHEKPAHERASHASEPKRPQPMTRRIKKNLLKDYDKTTRPVLAEDHTVNVSLGLSLFHILETDEKSQTIVTLLSLRASWTDELLVWDSKKHGSRKFIWLPASTIWIPDLAVTNNADSVFSRGSEWNAIVRSDGKVKWMFPAIVKTYCSLDVRYFPFDAQRCEMDFISWTYSGNEVDLHFEINGTRSYYREANQQWHVVDIHTLRDGRVFPCCPGQVYPTVRFVIHMRRRSLFYVLNLIVPGLVLFSMSFLGFMLPVESGEKVNLEITLLLAMMVFLMVVVNMLPPTPDAVPLLGQFFGATMMMLSFNTILAVAIVNYHYKKDSSHPPPNWLRRLVAAQSRFKCPPWSKGEKTFCCVGGGAKRRRHGNAQEGKLAFSPEKDSFGAEYLREKESIQEERSFPLPRSPIWNGRACHSLDESSHVRHRSGSPLGILCSPRVASSRRSCLLASPSPNPTRPGGRRASSLFYLPRSELNSAGLTPSAYVAALASPGSQRACARPAASPSTPTAGVRFRYSMPTASGYALPQVPEINCEPAVRPTYDGKFVADDRQKKTNDKVGGFPEGKPEEWVEVAIMLNRAGCALFFLLSLTLYSLVFSELIGGRYVSSAR